MKCKQFYTFLFAFFLLTGSAFSQQVRTVTGIVSSSQQNVPLAAVSVMIKGTNSGTFTNMSGVFKINVPEGATSLVFSYIGYHPQEIPVTGDNINVTLYPDSSNLGDVVVIGYGAVRKEDVSGAVTTLTTKDFQTGTVTSIDQMMQGKAAGVSITPNGGKPGSGGTILIRGISTINGNASPLVVVDGLPFGEYVNPDDIESVTILKDASATAIYGSQASGGVIMITTKKGRPGEVKLNFNTLVSDATIPKYVSVLNGAQYRNIIENNPFFTAQPGVAAMLGNANTDWQKQIYRSAVTSNSNLSVRGAFGKALPYRLSVGYLNQDGILNTDNMQRETGALSLTPSMFQNHLKIELNLIGSLTQQRNANQGAIGNAVLMDPTEPVRSDSSAFQPWGGYFQWLKPGTTVPNNLSPENPVALLNQTNDRSTYNRGSGNLKLDYSLHFLPELHLIANWGFDVSSYNDTYKADSMSIAAYRSNGNLAYGSNNPSHNTVRNLLAEYTLNYNKTISSIKSNINAMATYSYQDSKTTTYNYRSYDYKGDTIPNSTPPLYPYSLDQRTLISVLGRLIYTYDDKYVFTGSYRRDGSSVLSPANRWVGFYSLALAWNIKKENFLKNSNVVSALKLRASYGQTANQGGIPNYAFYQGYYLGNQQSEYQFGNTFYPMYTPSAYNDQLTWETTTSPDFGIDFGFLNDRISGSFDWYDKHTKNLLVNNVPIPAGTNFSNVASVENVGNMTDKGVELNLSAIPIQTKNIEWTVNFNAGYTKSRITKLFSDTAALNGVPAGGISGGTGATIQGEYVGQAPNSFLVNQQVYNAQGQPIEGAYVDRNGDGIVAPGSSDLYYYHSPYPSWVLGFSTNFRYKKWTFSTVLRANIGNYVYNNVESNTGVLNLMGSTGTGFLQNASSSVLNTGFITQQLWSDYYVQNASFLKMDNLGISYNVGKLGHSDKTSLTISANVQNVFTVTKYTGITPEIPGGIDNNFYPVPRTYTIGANLNF